MEDAQRGIEDTLAEVFELGSSDLDLIRIANSSSSTDLVPQYISEPVPAAHIFGCPSQHLSLFLVMEWTIKTRGIKTVADVSLSDRQAQLQAIVPVLPTQMGELRPQDLLGLPRQMRIHDPAVQISERAFEYILRLICVRKSQAEQERLQPVSIFLIDIVPAPPQGRRPTAATHA